jgi:hypothetical protein
MLRRKVASIDRQAVSDGIKKETCEESDADMIATARKRRYIIAKFLICRGVWVSSSSNSNESCTAPSACNDFSDFAMSAIEIRDRPL